MQTSIKTTHHLQADPQKVWSLISKASGVHEWLPIVTNCSLDGNRRTCTTELGDLEETILDIDHDHKVFKYAIRKQPLLPIQNCTGTMQVIDKGNTTELLWEMDCEILNIEETSMIQKAVEDLY